MFFLSSWAQAASFALFLTLALPTDALPQPKRAKGKTTSANSGATTDGATIAAATKITVATDGSTIMDKTVTINGLSIRYKISAPTDQFTTASGVTGGAAAVNSTGTNGLNVLLHGDGGQSFIDFPNQAVQDNLMGVVVLAPNSDRFWGGGSGLDRTDGVAHSSAVNSLIQQQLAQDVAFDPTKVFFTGVSGGSIMLSGFFLPAFGATYQTGVVLACGALEPQVTVVDANTLVKSMKIHFQTTSDELALLHTAIPAAVTAYEKLATDAGMSDADIGAVQTVDSTPDQGGHCGFDGVAFVSGVQLLSDGYSQIISNGGNAKGVVTGINAATVLKVCLCYSTVETC
ncbi:hypothetical protein BJ878DRAFT_419669 [Calycina marina]|uniref:Cyclin-like f-box protein n=1 Tax=Calycina marina TaxID=1763456 RepID=A0A9P8CFJ3_9HELO|nr:hypothetical protein BJ878DRAFT_419669 [Calycina marina]